ncbi:hypothetical protein Pcinc_022761 [Petrolisthes cinctipes]|uniref:HAT C-terminal dimerisation domain-containing protein n=1 Tax=Petrolisthes cinctipes TaxID=88211 RepID=A0AAE1KHT5_PETCI|nr:hypothetical protein Pcinc_022761 [Petrolisthes cinctipes]
MITTDLQPASIVEDYGFQKFVSGLDPRYEMPSRRKIMRDMLPSAYNSAKASLKKLLEEIEDIALTTDIWTSRQTQAFMCVTAHFINSDWVLKSHVLETVQLKTAHTADTIASELKRVAEEWSVGNKIRMIVTDNASNMTRAVSLVGWRHIPCFAHTINLVVTNSISAIDGLKMLVKKVKGIVTFFHSSVKASDKLAEIQIQNKIPEHKLIQDVDTQWNSSFYMLERMIEQHDAVTTVLCLLGRNNLCLSPGEVTEMRQAVDTLRPFELATKEISADLHLSVSKIVPISRMLMEVTASESRPDRSTTVKEDSLSLNVELQLQIRKRFSNVEANYSLAAPTFLDPRFKKVPFSNKAMADQAQRRIETEMCSVPQQNLAQFEEPDDPGIIHVPSPNEEPTEEAGLWSWFGKKANHQERHRTSVVDAALEMRHYAEGKLMTRTDDPLEFWKMHSLEYPRLSAIAKKYLCIPATSVPSERLFSKAGELVSAKRSRLKAKNINMFLFLNKNT